MSEYMEEKPITQNTINPPISDKPTPKLSRIPKILNFLGWLGLGIAVIGSVAIVVSTLRIRDFYNDASVTLPNYHIPVSYLTIVLLFFIPISQLIFGKTLSNIQKSSPTFTKFQEKSGLLLIAFPAILPMLVIPMYLYSVLHPLYHQKDTIQKTTSVQTSSSMRGEVQTPELFNN